jgi:hypothetical protein
MVYGLQSRFSIVVPCIYFDIDLILDGEDGLKPVHIMVVEYWLSVETGTPWVSIC